MPKKPPSTSGELVELPQLLDTVGKGGERVLFAPSKLIGITERAGHCVLLFDGGVSMELDPSYDEFLEDMDGGADDDDK